jgi:hypothetical protein
MTRIKKNPTVIPARVRSGAGPHARKEEIPCAYCGAPVKGLGEFCSRDCEKDVRDLSFHEIEKFSE